MTHKYTSEELHALDSDALVQLILGLQDQIDKLNSNYEDLIEQIRIANASRYGRRSEKQDVIDGQIGFMEKDGKIIFFINEAESLADESVSEPTAEEAVPSTVVIRKRKKKTSREDLVKGIPEESVYHRVSSYELDRKYGAGNWRKMKTEEYKRLRYTPASWTVEHHFVEVYVGTGGDHQDEFTRGSRRKDVLRNSIATPSLVSAILTAKYVNANPLYRIEQEFNRNGVFLSRQTMANWVIYCSMRYFAPLWERLKEELLKYHVNQADETTVNVVKDGRPAGTDSYMWVHRSGEFYTDHPIVLFEYQKTRSSDHPKEFYRDYTGILVTDSLEQYHKLERDSGGRITSANCWAHARRAFSDVIKAIGKSDEKLIKKSMAHQALVLIGSIYNEENKLKDLSPEERLTKRQECVKPKVDAYFSWVRERLADTSALPRGKTMQGLNYCINNERYLRVFLTDGEVPIDNSASERAVRPFTTGRRNWVIIDTIRGAQASAIVYSLAETAKLNGLNPYYYFNHLLTELPQLYDDKGNMDTTQFDSLLPWAAELPEECQSPRR